METMEKTQRFVQLKKLAVSVISYWSILPVPVAEKVNFMPLYLYAKAESVDEIPEHKEDFIKIVENECKRLEKCMADLILRKKSKLAQIYQLTHLEQPSAGQGPADISLAFKVLMEQISIAKALSIKRQDIVTRVEILQNAWHEIQWYLADDFDVNSPEDHERVATGHMLFQFFPKMIEDIEDKVATWSITQDSFEFDGVDVREMLKDYKASYAMDTDHEDPEAGGASYAMDTDHEDPEAGGASYAMDTDHEDPEAGGVGTGVFPIGLVAGGIDILHQLVIPRQPRTPRQPPPQPQVLLLPPPPPQPQVLPPPPLPQPQVLPPPASPPQVVPRQPRTPRIPVQVNVQQPPPQPQVLPLAPSPLQPSGDDSVASTGSKSDSRDLDYDPSGSGTSDE